MQKVIGLDLGTYSIKAVEIVNTFKSYEITNFYENVVPHLEDVPKDLVIQNSLEQLFQENNLQADRIIAAMPGQYVSSRIMSFNFSDPKKIESAVSSEVEDFVPFNLDDMIVDQQILGQLNKQTIVLAVMAKKLHISAFLENLRRVDIDPKLVDIDSLAFYNLTTTMKLNEEACTALVDIGHEKTSVCIVKNGVLRMFRTINLGGQFITDFLARDLEISFTQAQRLKHRVSQVGSNHIPLDDLNDEDRVIAERLTVGCNTIVNELGRTLYSFKTWEKAPVEHIYLSGGTALLKGIDHYLMEQLEIPVSFNRLHDTSLKISPELDEKMAVMPQSVSIGMRAISGVKRLSTVNLRRGEFTYVQDYEQVIRTIGTFATIAMVALIILVASFFMNQFIYNKETASVHKQYAKLAQDYFGVKSKKGKINFKSLKKKTEKKFKGDLDLKKSSMEQFVARHQGSHALIALSRLSSSLPADVVLDVYDFEFKPSKTKDGSEAEHLEVKMRIDSFNDVAKITKGIEADQALELLEAPKTSDALGRSNKKTVAYKLVYNQAYRFQ